MKVSKGASSEFTVHSISLPHLFFFNRFIYLFAFFFENETIYFENFEFVLSGSRRASVTDTCLSRTLSLSSVRKASKQIRAWLLLRRTRESTSTGV